ncbi:MAG: hypothetical protein ACE5KK_06450 [Candidatus Brocadiales bacterium]
MNDLDKNHLLCLCLALLMLCCHGCLFGGEKKEERVVYPVATKTVPQKVPEEEAKRKPVNKPVKQGTTTRAFQEIDKRLSKLSQETKEAQEDLLTRITALEDDSQQLKDKLSLVEFLQGESSNEITKMREGLEFELESLREQIEDYNALLIDILNRISSAPEDTVQPEPTP